MTDPIDELRARAASAAPPPPEMADYLANVRTRAYSITDADIDELKRAGFSEDAIFEATVTVATAEGLGRLDRANEVIG